jgi:hypothetical protein
MEYGLKRCEAHWLFAAGLALGLMFAVQAEAQTFEEGYQSYMRNQFPVAELQFRAAAKKARTKEDRAFIQKFIGICQYMRGDRKSAAASFLDSLGLDRNITIDEEEVLDPGVVTFFAAIKSRWLNSPEGRMASAPAPAPKAAPVPAPAAMAQAPKPAAQATPPPPKAPTADPRAATVAAEKRKKFKEKDSAKPEEGGRMISWMHFMPFGLGQFYNESYFLGSALAAGQVFALYQFTSLDQQIKDERAQSQQVADNPNILQAEKDQFLLDNESYIDGLTSDKSTAVSVFAALYISGVAQALIFAPQHPAFEDGSGPETSKKRRKKAINTAWIPGSPGGTYLVQVHFNL